MTSCSCSTPVLFLVFNRPETTRQVFEAIRSARPPYLYVAADGPRSDRTGEAQRCQEVRRIASEVDWPCEVKTLYRDSNLGCKLAVSSAIDWFFKHVDRGIILEDDCLPSVEFFKFCESMLNSYQDDTRVMHIAGTNRNSDYKIGSSYSFSHFTPVWGWATWKRAWKYYDVNVTKLVEFREAKQDESVFPSWKERMYRMGIYKMVRDGKINTWDYQWNFAVLANHGLSIIPKSNLVENIGFGEDATHTRKAKEHQNSKRELESVFPINAPLFLNRDYRFDEAYFSNMVSEDDGLWKIVLKSYIPPFLYHRLKGMLR